MTDMLDQKIKSSPDTFANAVGDETVLLQVKHGVYFGLDPVGTEIWQGLDQGQSPRAICERIARTHSMDLTTVEADARKFLEDLKANGIIVVD